MDTSLLDLLYENRSINGVALTSSTGVIIENQLTLPDPSLEKIAKRVSDLRISLDQSSRQLKGFVLKADQIAIQLCVFDSFFIFVQADPSYSAQSVETSVRSIFDNEEYLPHTAPVETSLEEPAVSQIGLSPDEISSTDEGLADGYLSLSRFTAQLTSFLCQREDLQDVNEIVTEALATADLAENAKSIAVKDAISVGHTAISNVSSAKHRKYFEKEFQVISSWMNY